VTVTGAWFDETTAPTATDGTVLDFTSTALEQLAFRVPNDADPGYQAALTFRTRVAAERIRFVQPATVWLEGRDCIAGGALLPRPNSHYRIDLDYVRPRTARGVTTAVRGLVTGMDFAGCWTTPGERDAAANAALLAVAEEWWGSTAAYRPAGYGKVTPLDENWSGASEIDCSTFSGYVYRGIGPARSRYANSAYSNKGTVSWALNDLPRTAAEQARMMVARGWNLEPGDRFENLRAGDLLFFAQGHPEGHVAYGTRWGHISHVGIAGATLDNVWAGNWELGTFSASTGAPSASTSRARTSTALPVPLDPTPEGLLLAIDPPYCLIATHFYAGTATTGWITSNGLLEHPYLRRSGRRWCPVPRGATHFRVAVGKLSGSRQLDLTASDFPLIRLSWGRPMMYEATAGSGGPLFRRGLSIRNLTGLRLAARPPLS